MKEGDKVMYVPYIGCPRDEYQNGIIKSIKNDSEAFVVFNCDNDWDNYKSYTANSTSLNKLVPGWNREKLTLEDLDKLSPGAIISSGLAKNEPGGLYMTDENLGNEMIWVAVRGDINDWAIYTDWAYKGIDYIIKYGNKVYDPQNIERLVPCTEEAFDRYRY